LGVGRADDLRVTVRTVDQADLNDYFDSTKLFTGQAKVIKNLAAKRPNVMMDETGINIQAGV
jgi:hypothetical protein